MVAVKEDFLRLLKEDAEFKAEVRRAVLTDELLNLPEMFAQMSVRMDGMSVRMDGMSVRMDGMSVRMDEMTVRMDAMTVRMDEMSERIAQNGEQIARNGEQIARNSELIAQLIAQMAEMNARMGRAENDIAVLKGDTMELKMVNRIIPFISGKLELRAGFIVRGGQPNEASVRFDDLLYDAYKSGAIDDRERDRINATDLIVSAVSRVSGARTYVSIEASYVIDVRDVSRARDSADILARAFPDAETHSAVYGRHVNPDGRAEADRLGVSIYEAPPDASVYRQPPDSS